MPRFVVQKHHASRLHYDFRLEMDGALKSWAVPKQPVADTKVRRLAIQVEDHDLEHIAFEGVIADGHYGAGRVEVWDNGEYELLDHEEHVIRVLLHGRKMKGRWKLVNVKSWQPNAWLLCKSKDAKGE